MSAPETGLRELKKQLTRESIATAALDLSLEKGLDSVTIDEIAQQAFVSPRTVSNYFSCKEEAVVAADTQDSFVMLEQFEQHPTTESPLETLCELLVDFTRSRSAEQLARSLRKLQLAFEYPTLRPFQTAQYDQLEEALRDVIAARTGTDVDSDMYPWLVASAAVSAVRTATRLWGRGAGEPETLVKLIQAAFHQVSNGLALPVDWAVQAIPGVDQEAGGGPSAEDFPVAGTLQPAAIA